MDTSTSALTRQQMVDVARAYFRLVDGGEGSLPDLFAADCQVFFPKYGTAKGREQLGELAAGLLRTQNFFRHDLDSTIFTAEGDRLAVEGLVTGESADGRAWPAHPRNEGRYCNVFEFSGSLISRLHVHEDPDFLTEDTDRLLWD